MLARAVLVAAGSFAFGLLAPLAASAQANRCATLEFAFEPDCFEPPCEKPRRKLGDRLDLGPQIAVWIETQDRSRFIDTLLVTNLTARLGVANRPGLATLPSGPKHPYGKRLQSLPIWAWARGRLYPQVVMQDGHEEWMGFHESISTPDPYYCRPMALAEVDVDAISCPTKVFNSAKGRLASELPQVPYPPRNDLMAFSDRDCDDPLSRSDGCPTSAKRFSSLNDLDAVAAATPPFGAPFVGRWSIPQSLERPADYVLFVEVNREFDQNASHRYTAYEDKMLSNSGFTQTGLPNNLGQPSVVFRVPFRLDGFARVDSAHAIFGYGDVDGGSGTVHPPDSSISDAPGSGAGRLRAIGSPWGSSGSSGSTAKVFVRTTDCSSQGGMEDPCQPAPLAPLAVEDMVVAQTDATGAEIEFRHMGHEGHPVVSYDIRLRQGASTSEENFLEGTPVGHVTPQSPGTVERFAIRDLKPLSQYVLGIRAIGRCGTQSPLVQKTFTTKDLEFTQLTGCFVATAAYGSPMSPALDSLRAVRDRAQARSAVAAAAVELYERSSPPVAAILRESAPARAVVRRLLGPLVNVAEELVGPGTPAATDGSPAGATGIKIPGR